MESEEFSESWITVAVFTHPHDCYVPKALLEDNEIVVFLKDEFSIRSNELWSHALGGIKLQVQKEDQERARQLLIDHKLLKADPSNELGSYFSQEPWEVETYTLPVFIVVILCVLAALIFFGKIF